jgi:hypothetical protein
MIAPRRRPHPRPIRIRTSHEIPRRGACYATRHTLVLGLVVGQDQVVVGLVVWTLSLPARPVDLQFDLGANLPPAAELA